MFLSLGIKVLYGVLLALTTEIPTGCSGALMEATAADRARSSVSYSSSKAKPVKYAYPSVLTSRVSGIVDEHAPHLGTLYPSLQTHTRANDPAITSNEGSVTYPNRVRNQYFEHFVRLQYAKVHEDPLDIPWTSLDINLLTQHYERYEATLHLTLNEFLAYNRIRLDFPQWKSFRDFVHESYEREFGAQPVGKSQYSIQILETLFKRWRGKNFQT